MCTATPDSPKEIEAGLERGATKTMTFRDQDREPGAWRWCRALGLWGVLGERFAFCGALGLSRCTGVHNRRVSGFSLQVF